MSLTIPEPVRLKALASGSPGAAWLASLDDRVQALAHRWSLSLGQTLTGGTEALVLEATLADGRAAVLKLLPPELVAGSAEFRILTAAQGHGYADVYAVDEAHGAVLLERLGAPLATLGYSLDQQITLICATLRAAWSVPVARNWCMDGAEKARSLSAFIEATWHSLGQPCPANVIDTALHYASQCQQRFDQRRAVLAHGDAHAWNTLLVPGSSPASFKFIDPDGLLIEPAYDLAIPMREWSSELLAGDALLLGQQRCQRLAELTGIDPEPIWQWGFVERVSTGLLCLHVGLAGGQEIIAVAERWAKATG